MLIYILKRFYGVSKSNLYSERFLTYFVGSLNFSREITSLNFLERCNGCVYIYIFVRRGSSKFFFYRYFQGARGKRVWYKVFTNAKDSYTLFSLAREIFLPRQQNVHFSMLLASSILNGRDYVIDFSFPRQLFIFSNKREMRKRKEERVKEIKCRFIFLFVWFMNDERMDGRSTVRIRIDTFFALHYDTTLEWESSNSWSFCEKFPMERINDILFRFLFDTE